MTAAAPSTSWAQSPIVRASQRIALPTSPVGVGVGDRVVVVSGVVVTILWQQMYSFDGGLLNRLLTSLGLGKVPWIVNPDIAMGSVAIMATWKNVGIYIVLFLVGLQNIPRELYEAASLDGAAGGRRFLHITLPQIRGILFVVILLRSIWMFTKFDTVWLMGEGGGAGRFIRTLPVYAYMRTLTYYQAGLGAAIAVVMFAILIVSTVIYFGLFREEADIG